MSKKKVLLKKSLRKASKGRDAAAARGLITPKNAGKRFHERLASV